MTLLKVNADLPENDDLCRDYDIMSIPTLIILDSDNKEIGRMVGQQSKVVLQEWLEDCLQVKSVDC